MRNWNRIIVIGSLFLLVLIILFIKAPGLRGDISKVKNGYMNFDKSITVGQAFERYKYFGKKAWTKHKDKQGRRYVIFKAQMNPDFINECNNYRNKVRIEPLAAAELTIQFKINDSAILYPSGSQYICHLISKRIADSKLGDDGLECIYKNKLFPEMFLRL